MSSEERSSDDDLIEPEVGPVRAGDELDFEALTDYLRATLPELEGPAEVLQFGLGSANLTYLLTFGDERVVVRRPPFGLIAAGAHDMAREFRAITALSPVYPRTPRALHLCDDSAIIGAPFLVMEYRAGVVVRGAIPESMRHHEGVGARLGLAVVDALADLHLLDPVEHALSGLGKGDGYLERQLSGWKKRWHAVAPPENDDVMTSVGADLERTMPASEKTTVLHNDFKLDNCQFEPDDPDRAKSVFDWDMATLGDPLADLGALLNYWPDMSDTDDDCPMLHEGMSKIGLPSRAEVVERYAERTAISVEHAAWYESFACFRTAVILQQLHNRYLRGETVDERMAGYGLDVSKQARRAARVLRSR